jgi:F420-dependent oxidoreductase-like protein
MKIGITVGLGSRSESTIDGLTERVADAEKRGFASAWSTNAFGFDAMTALAAAARHTTTIELGTAVVPTYPRHPVVMAQQALTVQSASNGRFTLGIGLSHTSMITDALGLPFDAPAKHMREYLEILNPLLEGKPANLEGELYNVRARVAVGEAKPVPVVVAALGPMMLKLAGEFAAGTITSWVGPRTLDTYMVPRITKAAANAGRPAPRVVVGLPIGIAGDADNARAAFAPTVAGYGRLPSYRAMFDREGVSDPSEVAIFGDEAELERQLKRLEDAGATDFAAQVVSTEPGAASRTLDFLANRSA